MKVVVRGVVVGVTGEVVVVGVVMGGVVEKTVLSLSSHRLLHEGV